MNTQIENAIQVLKNGGVILYPTDTIWGLGCDATNPIAVEKIYKIKNREDSKSLIILASNADMICKYIKEMPEIALSLIEVNDKPMTIIYPNAINLAPNVIAEDGSVGIRIPNNTFCNKLISKFNKPIVSTSANISGDKSPLFFKEISKEIIELVDYVIDPSFEKDSTHSASQIIKVGIGNEIKIIRK